MKERFLKSINALVLTAASCTNGGAIDREKSFDTPSPVPTKVGIEKTIEPKSAPTKTPEPTINIEALKSIELRLPWMKTQTWYLLTGPHFIGTDPANVLNAIDLAPIDIIGCKPPPPNDIIEKLVLSSASGKIIEMGRNPSDPNYSIIRILHDNGLVTGYMHLKDITGYLKVGDKETLGLPLGFPSCAAPRGGRTTGIHLHFFVEAYVAGRTIPIPIDGFKMEGWTIRAGEKYGEGKMTKPGEKDRVADPRRCAPCGGIRNDIPNPSKPEYFPGDPRFQPYQTQRP